MASLDRGVSSKGVNKLLDAERKLFAERNPKSKALAARARQHWLEGVPMHWMVDWGTPFALFIAEAKGVHLTDADGNRYVDFCLGDTGAMFGHSPDIVVKAITEQAKRGLTTMLPAEDAVVVGELLSKRFGMSHWQVTATATDANRCVLRWARAITGRPKILVYNGCYHGAVDDTYVALSNGKPRNRPGLIGEVRDVYETTTVIEFNDLKALEQALKAGDVACVLAEPVMTNCSMVLPDEGYHTALRDLTRKTGTLLVIDETHTISSGPGGYTATHNLEPDFFVLGKPIAGGVPTAVYGWTREVNDRIEAFLATREPGYSGIGTTLSGNALQLHCMRAVLENIMTEATYAKVMPLAERLERELARQIEACGLPWHVVRVGLRVEIVPAAERPRNGTEAGLVAHSQIEHALHLYCLNRGAVITPFHNMLLVCPETKAADVDALLDVTRTGFAELAGIAAN